MEEGAQTPIVCSGDFLEIKYTLKYSHRFTISGKLKQ